MSPRCPRCPRCFLIHWHPAEAKAHAAALRELGWEVAGLEAEDGGRAHMRIRELAEQLEAVVVYLTRLPSHGRATAAALRRAKATRELPLILVGGKAEAVEKARAQVEDAIFVAEEGLAEALRALEPKAGGG